MAGSIDEAGFHSWLTKSKGMSNKSGRDVVSRLKRLLQYTSIRKTTQRSALESALSEFSDYENMSMFVRSQLKRAGCLYAEYLRDVSK